MATVGTLPSISRAAPEGPPELWEYCPGRFACASTGAWKAPQEPLLSTCRETRVAALENGIFLFKSQEQPGFCVRSDVVLVNLGMAVCLLIGCKVCQEARVVVDGLRPAKNFAIEWSSVVLSHGLGRGTPVSGRLVSQHREGAGRKFPG
ncbi:hypothetical protein DL766_009823 [Monosporascus sp. MC13-8B]|uniref:Uncharacterized protein n=1 Tax=Monosporascus cannonballus TaxID=155416 RepID=A0ABY0GXD1_9PEZI|nr:hypothetical protein DL762_008259 [Monosporascus cannonballus]RYO81623.1 hypothetical protein DL763_008527 [Monosporascus cannonballus]RYP13643.1 hypothetical protein DL766_009823 [Monosporascus sp. MC13-8B]